MEVPTGTRMTYVCEYDPTRLLTFQTADLLSAVTTDLSKENIIVESSNISDNWLNAQSVYTLKLLLNDAGHASEIDVQRIVDHTFGIEAGTIDYYPPSSSRISEITLPGGTSTSTGAPPTPNDNSDPNNTNTDKPSLIDKFLELFGLGSPTTSIVTGVLIGGAIIVGGMFLLAAVEAKA